MTGPYDDMIADETPQGARTRHMLSEELDQTEKNSFAYLWEYLARKEQLPPPGDWRVWMIMAGRGFGKTRSGAEWVRMVADSNPEARIALVSSSLAEARAVMVEGESGLLAICRPGHKPIFEPSLHRVRFKSGAQAQLFSAAEPESLRGPQHSHASGTGAKGVLRQSGPRHTRCVASPRRHGIPACSSSVCGRRGCFRVTAGATQAWEGGAERIAVRISDDWHLIAPRQGMTVFDQTARQILVFQDGWQSADPTPPPAGGSTIDIQAREAIAALIQSLQAIGVLSAPVP